MPCCDIRNWKEPVHLIPLKILENFPKIFVGFPSLATRNLIEVRKLILSWFQRLQLELIKEHINALTTKFSEQRIDYVVLNTSEPLDRAMFSYLSSREKLMRVR